MKDTVETKFMLFIFFTEMQLVICYGHSFCIRGLVYQLTDLNNSMSHIMRKPVYAICKQQMLRSACASMQSDQCLCCLLPRQYNVSSFYIFNFMALSGFSWLSLASLAEQAGLSLTWSKTLKTGFMWSNSYYYFWAGLCEKGTYIGNRWRLRWACTSSRSYQSLHCSHTQY